jgi:hypothetical protein
MLGLVRCQKAPRDLDDLGHQPIGVKRRFHFRFGSGARRHHARSHLIPPQWVRPGRDNLRPPIDGLDKKKSARF